MARSEIFTDDFNRADAGSSPYLGANYTDAGTANGACRIQASTQVRGSNDWITVGVPRYAAYADATSGTYSNDQYADAKTVLAGTGGNYAAGVAVRISGTTSLTCYYATLYTSNGSTWYCKLGKIVSDTNTDLGGGAVSVTWVDGDRLGLEVEGTTLRVTRNGTAIGGALTTTDSSISTGNPGITAEGAVTTNRVYLDDFQAGDITNVSGTAQLSGRLQRSILLNGLVR